MKKTITIFGGTGDLTFRKLLPAMYNMHVTGGEGAGYDIVIIGRRNYTSGEYRQIARDWVKQFSRLPFTDEKYKDFSEKIEYYRMDFSDPAAYEGLENYYKERGLSEHIFYFAVAPRFFSTIAEGLDGIHEAGKGKVILEKPFGEDLESAKELSRRLEEIFAPDRIYRIDHYLGKEMVRNMQIIRFTNPVFANNWNRDAVSCIQISAMEDVGVENRAGYYDTSGAMKDMVQNHLLQILSIVAMERPASFKGEDLHEEQLKVLKALRPASGETIRDMLVLGQYEGYREEKGVKPDSATETYAALRLFVDNERWQDVPFYIRTGKKLGRREMEVAVIFRQTEENGENNVLLIKIQPMEGVYFQFNIKRPGESEEVIQTKMDFCQSCVVENRINTPEAYERLLGACMRGERSWFSQWDQIEAGWRYVSGMKRIYQEENLPIVTYAQGTSGPEAADQMLNTMGHSWFGQDD